MEHAHVHNFSFCYGTSNSYMRLLLQGFTGEVSFFRVCVCVRPPCVIVFLKSSSAIPPLLWHCIAQH